MSSKIRANYGLITRQQHNLPPNLPAILIIREPTEVEIEEIKSFKKLADKHSKESPLHQETYSVRPLDALKTPEFYKLW